MRLRATNTLRSRSMPVAPRGVGDEQLAERAASPRGRWRRGTSGSTGTSRQPSTVRPSSATIVSIAACAFSAATSSVGQERRCRRRSAPAGGQLEVDDGSRRKRSGTWIRMPAPSPVSASAPVAPRCSRLRQRAEAGAHEIVAAHAVHVGDERDAAGVVLESGVVETRRAGGWVIARLLPEVGLERRHDLGSSPGTTLARTIDATLRDAAPDGRNHSRNSSVTVPRRHLVTLRLVSPSGHPQFSISRMWVTRSAPATDDGSSRPT